MKRKRFCPRCGKQITQGTFCDECQEKRLEYEPPLIQISEFDRTFHNGTWHRFTDIEELIKSRIREALDDKTAKVDIEPFEFTPRKKEKATITAQVTTNDTEYELTATLAYRQCDYGEKRHSKYFEGALQLRNVSDSMRPFIQKRLQDMEHKGVFVTKTVELKKGVDLYLTDKTGIQQLARQVQQKYGGEIKISPQLFSHDHVRSKDIYRVNAFVKLPDYTVGDVIYYTKPKSPDLKHYLLITRMGKIIIGTDVMTGKLGSFEPGHTEEIQKIKQERTTIMSTRPKLTVMDPIDYQEDEVINIKALHKDYNSGDDVSIVKTEDGVMIIE
ncbi:MAG: NMD3-related protein [Nanobdellota archaeon]